MEQMWDVNGEYIERCMLLINDIVSLDLIHLNSDFSVGFTVLGLGIYSVPVFTQPSRRPDIATLLGRVEGLGPPATTPATTTTTRLSK